MENKNAVAIAEKPVSQNKTPDEMAKEIINSAFEDQDVTVTGTTYQKLVTVVRYLNRDKIQARSESWFQKNLDNLVSDGLYDVINARHKALIKYLATKDNADKRGAFVELLARGVVFKDAVAQTGYNPDLDTEK